MRKLIPILAIVLLPTALIISCGDEEDDCAATCQNGGICVADTCQCPSGFEGPLCATEVRAPMLGNYNAYNDICTGGVDYTVEITRSSTSGLHVNISNLGNYSFTLEGTITTGTDVFYFNCPAQTVTKNGVQVSVTANGAIYPTGSASMASYHILEGGVTTHCSVHL